MAFPSLPSRRDASPRRLQPAFPRLGLGLILGAIALGGMPGQLARAERPVGLRMCVSSNQPRNQDIYVALAYKTSNEVAGVKYEDWISQGWWKIPKSLSYSCVTLIDRELQHRYYYFYAQGAGRVWDGQYRFCMDPLKSYRTDEADINCENSGLARRGFRQIDTMGDRGFTYRLY